MAPQFESPKVVLVRQADIPRIALAQSPVAALGEGVSGILAKAASALPDLGDLPAGLGGAKPALPLKVAQVFKNIEVVLPTGAPSLSQLVASVEGQGSNVQIGVGGEKAPPAALTIKIGV